MKYTWKTCYIA